MQYPPYANYDDRMCTSIGTSTGSHSEQDVPFQVQSLAVHGIA